MALAGDVKFVLRQVATHQHFVRLLMAQVTEMRGHLGRRLQTTDGEISRNKGLGPDLLHNHMIRTHEFDHTSHVFRPAATSFGKLVSLFQSLEYSHSVLVQWCFRKYSAFIVHISLTHLQRTDATLLHQSV